MYCCLQLYLYLIIVLFLNRVEQWQPLKRDLKLRFYWIQNKYMSVYVIYLYVYPNTSQLHVSCHGMRRSTTRFTPSFTTKLFLPQRHHAIICRLLFMSVSDCLSGMYCTVCFCPVLRCLFLIFM